MCVYGIVEITFLLCFGFHNIYRIYSIESNHIIYIKWWFLLTMYLILYFAGKEICFFGLSRSIHKTSDNLSATDVPRCRFDPFYYLQFDSYTYRFMLMYSFSCVINKYIARRYGAIMKVIKIMWLSMCDLRGKNPGYNENGNLRGIDQSCYTHAYTKFTISWLSLNQTFFAISYVQALPT